MNFLERLAQAIKDKNIKKVAAMLQALQVLYDEGNFSIAILPATPVKITEKEEQKLSVVALSSDLEIFKLLINFFKKNCQLKIYQDTFADDINLIFYKAIFVGNLAAVQFLVEDLEVDLLKPSQGFKKVWDSPLHGSDENFEIFKFLFSYCVDAYQEASKDVVTDLLDPLRDFLISQKGNLVEKSLEADAKKIEILRKIEILEKELSLIIAFKRMYEIFSIENISTIYTNLGQSFPLHPEFCIRMMGNFLHTVANDIEKEEKEEKEKQQINYKKLLHNTNTIVHMLLDLLSNEKSEDQVELKKIFNNEIVPYYLAIASKAKPFSPEKDIKFYEFLSSTEGYYHENFHEEFVPKTAENTQETKQKCSEEKKDLNINDIKIPEIKANNSPSQLSDDATWELVDIYSIDKDYPYKIIELWHTLAKNGHQEAWDKLLNYSLKNEDHEPQKKEDPKPQKKEDPEFQFKINMLRGNLYYEGAKNNIVTPDLTLAINCWEKALSAALRFKPGSNSDTLMTTATNTLAAIVKNPEISIDHQALICNLLLNFYLLLGRFIDVFTMANDAIQIFQQAKLPLPDPLFPNIIKELIFILIDPKHQTECLELFASIEAAAQTTEINVTHYLENVDALFIIAHAIRQGHFFKLNPYRAAEVYLKIFQLCADPGIENQSNRHTALAELKKLAENDKYIAVKLAVPVYDTILKNQLMDNLELAIELLRIGARYRNIACLAALDALYKQYVNSENTVLKVTLSKQFLMLAHVHKKNTELPERAIESLMIKAIVLDPTISIPEILLPFKISIIKITKLKEQLNSWIANISQAYRLNFFSPSKNTSDQNHLPALITAVNEFINGIDTFLKYGEAKINLKLHFKINPVTISIKEINDINTSINLFMNKNTFQIPSELYLDLFKILRTYLIEESGKEETSKTILSTVLQ